MGILALSNHLDSYLIGRHHPFQLQQMDSRVWRATIHLLYSGDSAQQTVAPRWDSFEGKSVFHVALWNQRSGYSSESARRAGVCESWRTIGPRISLSKSLSKKSVKKSVLPPCTSHFESPGEDRQATPNRQIFKTGKGTVRIKTFLAKESQPRQVESQWIERAKTAHILPNQNEAALTLTKERVSTLIGRKEILRNLVFLTCQSGQEERRVNSIWSTSCLTRFPLVKRSDILSEMTTGKEICGSFIRQSA
ncbi:hypothetical protein AVEN_112806-1 [Araneus ventricosus]|uniref:Uncharacterized protein n=1 Tax=Araneus ventricosus TaxID=182803 RepID=A0A4Y2WFK1_ARAVE|nr:hypothetical protein AVEN_112806-1 [Araneus ventricosus]